MERKTCSTCKHAIVTRTFYQEPSGKTQWVYNYKFRFREHSPCIGCPKFLGAEDGIDWLHHEYPAMQLVEVPHE